MEEKRIMLTAAGLQKFEDELQDLKVNKRKMIASKIKEAREQGDISENAEYDSALDEQREIERRIKELENIINNAEIIPEDTDTDTINVGCKVHVRDLEFKEDLDLVIVGSAEADSLNGFISNESPLGSALLGAKKGQTVVVATPAGELRYKILKIANGSGSQEKTDVPEKKKPARKRTAKKTAAGPGAQQAS